MRFHGMELVQLLRKQHRGVKMNEKQTEGLKQAVQDRIDLISLLKHNGWHRVLEKRINSRINDMHKIWLKAKNAETAEMLRLRVAGYEGLFDIIDKVLKEGQNAQNLLMNPSEKYNTDNS